MSGWLDWHEDYIICPSCENIIKVIIVEDGDCDGEVSSGIAGVQKCPICSYPITDEVLNPLEE